MTICTVSKLSQHKFTTLPWAHCVLPIHTRTGWGAIFSRNHLNTWRVTTTHVSVCPCDTGTDKASGVDWKDFHPSPEWYDPRSAYRRYYQGVNFLLCPQLATTEAVAEVSNETCVRSPSIFIINDIRYLEVKCLCHRTTYKDSKSVRQLAGAVSSDRLCDSSTSCCFHSGIGRIPVFAILLLLRAKWIHVRPIWHIHLEHKSKFGHNW